MMLAVIAAAFAIVYFTPARAHLGNIQNIKYRLLSLGWVAPAVWMAIVFAGVAVGIPRLLFCPIGGLAFGFWKGLLWTQTATLAGYYVLFLFIRWGGQDFVLRHWPKVGRLKNHLQGHSAALLVFAVRQLPISGLIINFLLGLSPCPASSLSAGNCFRGPPRSHSIHAGSQRHIQTDRPDYTSLHRGRDRDSSAGLFFSLVFLPPLKIAFRIARQDRDHGGAVRFAVRETGEKMII